MQLRATVQATVVAVLMIGTLVPVASAADTETLFLGPEGVPFGSLIGTPDGGEMPNYDRGRDLEPGLLLERSDLGLGETDENRFQHWQTEMSGRHLVGYPSVLVWSAAAGFSPTGTGVFSVFLLDCPESAVACSELLQGEATVVPESSGTWIESEIAMPQIDHVFGQGRYLGVRIVVANSSETDMMFAYGYPKFRSRLTISPEAPLAAAEVTTVSAARAPIERLERVKPPPSASMEFEGEGEIASLTPWLAMLTASTVLLLLLGVVLVFTLSPHGRRERPKLRPHRSGGSETVTWV